jgi:hypothetical protein
MQKETHRCKELLEYNKNTFKPCAIQYQPFVSCIGEKPTWILKVLESCEEDWDIKYMDSVAKIKYCCFCGEKLNDK